jgi:hypothetical protein
MLLLITQGMGVWKKKQIDKHNKASRTTSNKAKLYVPNPPAGGWPAFTGHNYGSYGVRRSTK